ncbi:hypothetical protein Hanom_Chr14g01289531 [Helianthus anomalus]
MYIHEGLKEEMRKVKLLKRKLTHTTHTSVCVGVAWNKEARTKTLNIIKSTN